MAACVARCLSEIVMWWCPRHWFCYPRPHCHPLTDSVSTPSVGNLRRAQELTDPVTRSAAARVGEGVCASAPPQPHHAHRGACWSRETFTTAPIGPLSHFHQPGFISSLPAQSGHDASCQQPVCLGHVLVWPTGMVPSRAWWGRRARLHRQHGRTLTGCCPSRPTSWDQNPAHAQISCSRDGAGDQETSLGMSSHARPQEMTTGAGGRRQI